MTLPPPFLSMLDTGASSEGSIDPLSLATTYERLADRILPHVTVRMKRPRFVTAIAAGAHICDELNDQVAADGQSPAWLVYEWYLVEALVRHSLDGPADDMWGLPGIQKVSRTLRFGKKLGADSYLKTATVFGFTGVYLRLARSLQIVDEQMRLDEGGYELLRVWQEEQELEGFLSAKRGKGAGLRDACREAVSDALKRGYTNRSPSWEWWGTLHDHLRPDKPGSREAGVLATRLLHPAGNTQTAGVSEEFLRALTRRGEGVTVGEEPAFFRTLARNASDELKVRLEMIDAYEVLCRLLTDAFDLVRYLSTKAGSVPTRESDFAHVALSGKIVRRMPRVLERIEELFSGDPLSEDVATLLMRYRDIADPLQLFKVLVDHHEEAQRNKPPDGKRPWVERADGVMVRPQYTVDEEPVGDDAYVHDYRTASVSSFLIDLGKLPR